MENRLYYWKLACYETSGNLPKRAIGKSNFIDLSLLPKETMREEYRRYFLYRGGQVSLNTICHEKAYYHQVCKALLWSSIFVTPVAKKYRFMQFELDRVFDTR